MTQTFNNKSVSSAQFCHTVTRLMLSAAFLLSLESPAGSLGTQAKFSESTNIINTINNTNIIHTDQSNACR